MDAPRGQLPEPDAADVWNGRVSRIEGADVYVVVERASATREHGPVRLVAPAGMPAVGGAVAVAFDEDGEAVAYVPGVTTLPSIPSSLPPSGSAGGSLAGTYPNPSLATDSVGAAQIAAGAVAASELATGIVLQLASTGTTRKVAFGTGTITLTAVSGAGVTVAHALGATPTNAFAIPYVTAGSAPITLTVNKSTPPTTTQISFRGDYADGVARTVSIDFFWVAIG